MRFFSTDRTRNWAVGLGVLAVFVALRVPVLRLPYFGTEDEFIREALQPAGELNIGGHPILVPLLFRLSYLVLGWDKLRLLPFFFSLALLGMTMALGRRALGTQGGLLAGLLLAISPWSVYVSSELEIDGAFFAFFMAVFVWLYARLDDGGGQPRRGSLALCGAAFGCLWLINYSAVIIFGALGLHSLRARGLKQTLLDFSTIGLIGGAVFLVYPVFFPAHYKMTSGKAAHFGSFAKLREISSGNFRGKLYGESLIKSFIFMGPLFLWGLCKALSDPAWRRRFSLELILMLSFMGAILALLDPDRIAIYWSPLAPYFCILTAAGLLELLPVRRADLLRFALFLGALAGLTAFGPRSVIALHPLHLSPAALFSFLPVRYYFGPSLGLYLRAAAVVFAFGGCAVFAAAGMKRPVWTRGLAALALAYSFFYAVEYSYALVSPSMDRAGRAALAAMSRKPPKPPVYIHGYGLEAQMAGVQAVVPFMYDVARLPWLMRTMEKTGGSVVIFNAPLIGPESPLRQFLGREAVLSEVYSDGSIPLAEIWELKGGRGVRP